jgi:hypothetical protein
MELEDSARSSQEPYIGRAFSEPEEQSSHPISWDVFNTMHPYKYSKRFSKHEPSVLATWSTHIESKSDADSILT